MATISDFDRRYYEKKNGDKWRHLKPCPFCDSQYIEPGSAEMGYSVQCCGCGTEGPFSATSIEHAIQLWQQRGGEGDW